MCHKRPMPNDIAPIKSACCTIIQIRMDHAPQLISEAQFSRAFSKVIVITDSRRLLTAQQRHDDERKYLQAADATSGWYNRLFFATRV